MYTPLISSKYETFEHNEVSLPRGALILTVGVLRSIVIRVEFGLIISQIGTLILQSPYRCIELQVIGTVIHLEPAQLLMEVGHWSAILTQHYSNSYNRCSTK